MLKAKQHNWVTFYNPRNGKARVTACSACGIAKGYVVGIMPCKKATSENHQMKKMGWQELPAHA